MHLSKRLEGGRSVMETRKMALRFPRQTTLDRRPGERILRAPGQRTLRAPGQMILRAPGERTLRLLDRGH